MRIRSIGRHDGDKVELMMTPMIDIVFLLLIFFVMTFKIAPQEGDFKIKMPLAAPVQGPPSTDLPALSVRLTADANGRLAGIRFGQKAVRNFQNLGGEIRLMIGDSPGPSVRESTEVEIDADYDLRYEYLIQAITAISGYVDEDTGLIQKLVEKIKLAPPRKPGTGD